MKTYIYKLTHKYLKKPELITELYPFLKLYKSDDDEENVIAMFIRLPIESYIPQKTIKVMEKLYTDGTSEERKNWEDNNIKFDYVLNPDQTNSFKLILTDDITKDITQAQFCISLSDIDRGCVFINGPDNVAYYNTNVYDEAGLGDLIKSLLEHKVIYRKKVKYGNA